MEIFTTQLSNWRMVLAKGVELVDITAKSGLECFAPEYRLVMMYKDGQIDEEEYTQLYIEKMRKSFVENPVAWQELKNKDRVAYACYCPPGSRDKPVFCHRHIFVNLLDKYLTREGIEHQLKGEIR